MIKRIFLFVLTNILVITTLTIVLHLLGVKPYLTANGIDYGALMTFCLVWGMGGSIISLMMSRFMAKMFMGVKVVDPTRPGEYLDLFNRVQNIARSAGLSATPEVGVYDSPELNAFATGPSQRFALVAVSSGLLSRMSKDELDGVLAHEISHIRNGDMVTMTLLQGVVNAFVMFLARIIAFAVSQNSKEGSRDAINFLVVLVLQIVLSLLGTLVVMGFSRHREFRADAGSAQLVGANKMAAALEAIRRYTERIPVDASNSSLATLKINGGRSWFALFASHPPIEERLKALQTGAYRT